MKELSKYIVEKLDINKINLSNFNNFDEMIDKFLNDTNYKAGGPKTQTYNNDFEYYYKYYANGPIFYIKINNLNFVYKILKEEDINDKLFRDCFSVTEIYRQQLLHIKLKKLYNKLSKDADKVYRLLTKLYNDIK